MGKYDDNLVLIAVSAFFIFCRRVVGRHASNLYYKYVTEILQTNYKIVTELLQFPNLRGGFALVR